MEIPSAQTHLGLPTAKLPPHQLLHKSLQRLHHVLPRILQLIEGLGSASATGTDVRVLRRCEEVVVLGLRDVIGVLRKLNTSQTK